MREINSDDFVVLTVPQIEKIAGNEANLREILEKLELREGLTTFCLRNKLPNEWLILKAVIPDWSKFDFQIPKQRENDLEWLVRNFPIYNKNKPQCQQVFMAIKEAIRRKQLIERLTNDSK